MAESAKFWDKLADRYSQKPISDEAAYQKKLELTRQYLRPDMKIMEFGCGTGRNGNRACTLSATGVGDRYLAQDDRDCRG